MKVHIIEENRLMGLYIDVVFYEPGVDGYMALYAPVASLGQWRSVRIPQGELIPDEYRMRFPIRGLDELTDQLNEMRYGSPRKVDQTLIETLEKERERVDKLIDYAIA